MFMLKLLEILINFFSTLKKSVTIYHVFLRNSNYTNTSNFVGQLNSKSSEFGVRVVKMLAFRSADHGVIPTCNGDNSLSHD